MAGWAWCCCSSPYSVKQFENNSSMLELARVGSNGSNGCFWDGTYLVIGNNNDASPPGTFRFARVYDSTLSLQRTLTDDNPQSSSAIVMHGICGDATACSIRIQGGGTSRSAVKSVNLVDGSADWETAVDASGVAVAVAGDASGNVYTAVNEASVPKLYKFSSSGSKSWESSVDSSGTLRYLVVNGSAECWVSYNQSALILKRFDTSGSLAATVTIAGKGSLTGCGDSGDGIWVACGATESAPDEIRNYNSSGTLVTTISDGDINSGANVEGAMATDPSGNLYVIVKVSGSWKVRKYNSSGTLQWTGPDIGWSGSSGGPSYIAVDASYIFVSGQYVTA